MKKNTILTYMLLLICASVNAQFNFVSSAPAANSNGVLLTDNIVLNFNLTVNASTINSSAIVVTGDFTGLINGSFSGGGTTAVTFNPNFKFKSGEIIYVTITEDLESDSGYSLPHSQQFEFRTTSDLNVQGSTAIVEHFIPNLVPGVSGWASYPADMDGDGDMDVVWGENPGNKDLYWFDNDGKENFTTKTITGNPLNENMRKIQAADIDSDGDMDILGTTYGVGQKIIWYENDGSQNFTFHGNLEVVGNSRDVQAVDMDGDGDMDILATSSHTNGTVYWYRNDGSQNFQRIQIVNNVNSNYSAYAVDLDNDGDMDVVNVKNIGGNNFNIYWQENNGSQNFTSHALSQTLAFLRDVNAVDIDDDGDMDMIAAFSGRVAILTNDGSQNFTLATVSGPAGETFSVSSGDMDGDGDIDLLSANRAAHTFDWYENDGAQNFTHHNIYTNPNPQPSGNDYMYENRFIYPVDMDGDGDLDVVGNGTHANGVAWYEFTTTYTYNNTWTPINPSGNITPNDDAQVLAGTASFNQNISLNNLSVATGSVLNVEEVLTLKGDFTNNGSVVFISDNNSLGRLSDMSGSSLLGTGSITSQRYIPARRAFRFLSSPLSTTTSINANWQEGVHNTGITYPADNQNPNPGYGTHISGSLTGADGFDATLSGEPSLFLFNNATQTWSGISNTNTNTFEAGEAYRLMVRGDRSIDLTSNESLPTNTTLRITGSNANFSMGPITISNLNGVTDKFNFVGNPYQAIVNMSLVLAGSTNLNTNFFYVWDPTLGGDPLPNLPGGRGAYVTFTFATGSSLPSSEVNGNLMPGQAFFVLGSGGSVGSASLTFQESNKDATADETDVFRNAEETNAHIGLQLYTAEAYFNGETASDGLYVGFSADGSNAITANDAPKLGNLDENLCRLTGEDYISMEERALPQAEEILPLFINQYRRSDYAFVVEATDFDTVTAYLKDAYLDTETELINAAVINFSVDQSIPASIASDRFSIVFALTPLSVDENEVQNFSVYPNPTKGNFFVSLSQNTGEKVAISLYNLLGQEIYTSKKEVGANNQVEVIAENLASGVYVLEIEQGNKTFTDKLIIE